MVQLLSSLLIIFALYACSTAPENNLPFYEKTKLEQLVGLYKNKGEGEQNFYLSNIIWPDDDQLDHASISQIEVQKPNDATLKVIALSDSAVVKDQMFRENEDFSLKNGRIVNYQGSALLSSGPGNMLLGPSIQTNSLGLDEAGHGKYESSGFIAGLLFLTVPIVFAGSQEVRFERIIPANE